MTLGGPTRLILAEIDVRIVGEGFDWFALLSAIAAFATLGLLIYGAVIATQTLADAARTRDAQLLLTVNDQWASERVSNSLNLHARYPPHAVASLVDKVYARKPPAIASDTDYEHFKSLSAAVNLIELVGVLRARKALTDDAIYDAWAGQIDRVWSSWEQAVPRMRRHMGEPDLLRQMENLSLEMNRRIRARAEAERLSGATSSAKGSASRAEAEAEADVDARSLVPHRSLSTRRWGFILASLLALSAIYRALQRFSR